MTTTSTLRCLPRFGTTRNPERATLGPAVGEVARRLGKPFMPWQQYVADVALEVQTDDEPAPGMLVYGEIDLTVPRQSGKSTWLLAKATHRCTATGFFGPRQRVVYTAQTRQKAREKWDEDYRQELESSSTFRRMIQPFKGSGNEHFRFQNGSKWGIDANTESAGHGGTLDEAYIDEAFAQRDGRLEQAFRPAMITRPNTQLCVISTAGWLDESPFLWEKVQRGRLLTSSRVAYFEWSAEEDADPADPVTWWSCMPALGHTISEESIRQEFDGMGLPDFRRAYLNQWVPKPADTEETIIGANAWAACADISSTAVGPVAFAVDVSPDRSQACISVAGMRADGKPHVAIVESLPGTDWVVARTVEVIAKHPGVVGIDPAGPAGSLILDLEAAGVSVAQIKTRELTQTCGRIFDLVMAGDLRHRDEGLLNAAVAGARKRSVGDAWAWARKDARTDITPLYAATVALWAHGEHTFSGDPGIYVL